MAKKSNEPIKIPQMPFNDALRKVLSAPPQHQEKKKKTEGKKKKWS